MLRRRFTSERIRQERRRSFFVACVLGVVLFASSLFLLSQLSYVHELSIQRVSIKGVKTVPEGDVFNLLQPYLEGSYFHVFSKRNVSLIRTHVLEEVLYTAYPRFERVNVSRRGFSVLWVMIRERDPFAVWCSATEQCYFLDRTGLVYAPSPNFLSGVSFTRFGGGGTSSTTPVGSRFLPEEDFTSLNGLIGDLSKLSLKTTRIEHKDGNIDITVWTDEHATTAPSSFSLFVTASSSYTQAINDLTVILDSPDFKKEVHELSLLDYIDLRFDNKVFYKTKSVVEE